MSILPSRFTQLIAVMLALVVMGGCSSMSIPKLEGPKSELPKLKSPSKVEDKPATSSTSVQPESPILILIKDQQLVAAETLLKSEIKRHPRQVGPRTNLGLLYANSDRKPEAEVILHDVVQRHPNACAAQVRLGQLYRESFRFVEAETAYLTCLQHDAAYPAALLNLGILYELYRGSFDLALSHYERYQLAITEPDRKVRGWIADLSRRLASNNQLAEVLR
jgi:tetratricopeptide (TPR) repeat protein